MHVYGIAVIIFGGVMLGRISRIDFSTPVLNLQKQLASVRRQYVIGGMCVGLPWWLLWVPCAMLVFMALFGRSEEHTSELQSLMRISYAVFCLKKKKKSHIVRHTELQQY